MTTDAKKKPPSLTPAKAGSIVAKSVSQVKEGPMKGSWQAVCPGIQGSVCGDPSQGFFFTSPGWPTREHAEERLREHFAEHKDPKATTSELQDFHAKHGLRPAADGLNAELIPLDEL